MCRIIVLSSLLLVLMSGCAATRDNLVISTEAHIDGLEARYDDPKTNVVLKIQYRIDF